MQKDLIECDKNFDEDKYDAIDLTDIEKAFEECSKKPEPHESEIEEQKNHDSENVECLL